MVFEQQVFTVEIHHANLLTSDLNLNLQPEIEITYKINLYRDHTKL